MSRCIWHILQKPIYTHCGNSLFGSTDINASRLSSISWYRSPNQESNWSSLSATCTLQHTYASVKTVNASLSDWLTRATHAASFFHFHKESDILSCEKFSRLLYTCSDALQIFNKTLVMLVHLWYMHCFTFQEFPQCGSDEFI